MNTEFFQTQKYRIFKKIVFFPLECIYNLFFKLNVVHTFSLTQWAKFQFKKKIQICADFIIFEVIVPIISF